MPGTVLTLTGKRPGQQQFGLDTFTESYKCDATADAVLTDPFVAQMGDPHPDYQFMFITARPCYETGENASVLDLVYIGCLNDDGAGNPILPSQKPTSGGQVSSATTNTDADIFPLTVTNPATVTFYAITRTLSFISNDPDDASEPDDPPEITSLITWDLGFGVQPGFSIPDLVTYLLTKAFVQSIDETPPDVEPLVSGQFYQITKRKTRTLLPYGPPS
jgi:hypothetical protein